MPKKDKNTINVVKASGEKEPFSQKKVRESLQRAGAKEGLIKEIIELLKPKLYDGITTQEIYKHVFALLRERKNHLASKYNLKRAIMELGPSGYPFEKFLAKILESQGYKTKTNEQVKGGCVWHEIDVVAQKGRGKHMLEAKFHNNPGLKTDTKVALYVWGRFLDISSADGFDKAWLVTNTKLTSDAKKYCRCVGITAIGWAYPFNGGLRDMIEEAGLHPVTALESLSKKDKKSLLEKDVVTCRELLDNIDLIPTSKKSKVEKEARRICA